MSHCVGDLENSLLAEQRFDLVSGYDVALLKCLDCEILASVSVLRQDDFAEMSTAKHAQQSEAVQIHPHRLRVTTGLVSAVTILQASRHILALLTVIQVLLKLLLVNVMRRRHVWHRKMLRLL